ncbi:uncharacterized protein LOC133185590 [Saccostrea echinata]|uniref:uncharacterized protein LOC133185590 n=1 Tax=Saccostrea echinata TaxID=191078 RepID=UPI002A7F95BE|nr:uncharacterized protein LOC133185590 [Saccostrea echinata]
MPLGERIVTPVNLGRSPIKIDHGDKRNLQHAVTSNALVGILHQLASVVRLADDIFCDISEECQKVFEKSERISRKITFVEQFVKDLDAKSVTIPVGDLTKFSHCHDHHVAKHGFDCDLFTSDNRPHCIQDHYMLCETSPGKIMRGADLYRKDGLCTSRLFKLWPVALNEPKISSPDFNLPRRSQDVFTFEKKYKKLKLKERRKTIHITGELFPAEKKDQAKEEKEEENKPCDIVIPPSEVIKIDTSGTGFHRMQSFRKVLAKIEYEDVKKKKRRRTVSGVSESILQEIEKFEQKRVSTSGRDHVRDYNFEDLDVLEIEVPRDEEMAKYLDEIDAKIEERKEDERLFKEPKIMKFFPCRRSKSLPRCAKLNSAKALIERKSQIAGLNESELSLNSNHSNDSRQSRLTKRGSIISNKIKSLVRSNSGNRLVEKIHKSRPKSLDLDAIDFEVSSPSNLAKMPSMPDNMLTRKEMNLRVGPGTYYGFETESNTLPKRNIKRNEFPWESMPKDWTTSVKLREISKRHSSYTDRQSSSGHWSGSSSNRHSLDSDHVVKTETIPNSTSQYSLGNDSGRDSPIPPESRCGTESTGGYTGDDASTVAGDVSSVVNAKLDTETWLKSLAVRALGREEVTSSSAETISSLTRLTKKNIMALDLMMSSPQKRPLPCDDGESSVYSVDQEGFYTSFHNDSGLRKSSATLVDEDEEEEELSLSKDSQSLCSVDSVIHNPEGGEKFAGAKTNSGKIINKVSPPAPPKRTSSCPGVDPKSPHDSSSFSDTDQEAMSSRLISKTQISKTSIPSLCVMSDEDISLSRQTSIEGDPTVNKNSSESVASENNSLGNSTNPSSFSHFEGKGSLDNTNTAAENVYCQTLPKGFHSNSKDTQPYDYTKSWPRCMNKKSNEDHPKSGILKSTDRSMSGPKTPKSLNFSPVINMFNPGMPLSLQLPLVSSPTSSEDGGKETKVADLSEEGVYKLTVQEERKDIPLKYHPTLVVKPGARAQSSERKSQESQKVPSEKETVKTLSFEKTQEGHYPTCTNVPIHNGTLLNQTASNSCTSFSGMYSTSSFGSINSLESAGSMSLSNSLTYVTRESTCSSPNLSNLDVPMMNTPTGSFESLSEQSTFSGSVQNQYSYISDNSNFSSTIETIAITTTCLDSFNETQAENQSFRTFSGPPMSTSTPHSSVSRMENHSRNWDTPPERFKNSEPTYKPAERGRRRTKQAPAQPSEPERKMKSTTSLPEHMVNYTSTKYQERTRNYKPTKQAPSNSKRGAVVNVMNLNNSASNYGGSNYAEESSNRTDSYRVAMAEPTNDRNSHKGPPAEPSNRTDSYRVAMGEGNSYRTGSYRVAMRESLSCPSFQQRVNNPPPSLSNQNSYSGLTDSYPPPTSNDDYLMDCTRTDSYRVAVRNNQGVVNNELVQRNSSYRVAVNDMEPIMADSRMNGLDAGSELVSGRDSRRMGITNIDQVKDISGGNQGTKIIGGVDVSKIDTSKVVRRRPKTDVDPISVISSRDASKNANKSHKSNSKRHSTSSTYIKFDPIFEVGEDMMLSMESLKTGSNSSLKMSSDFVDHGYGFNKEAVKVGSSGSQKYPSEKSSSSLIGSIKSTLKSMSGNSKQNSSNSEDDWRFSMV